MCSVLLLCSWSAKALFECRGAMQEQRETFLSLESESNKTWAKSGSDMAMRRVVPSFWGDARANRGTFHQDGVNRTEESISTGLLFKRGVNSDLSEVGEGRAIAPLPSLNSNNGRKKI